MKRVFVAEPLFKAYCTQYGRGVNTSYHIHFVEGKGRFIVGNYVKVDGKCSFLFAARFSDSPTLTIGDHTGIGHNCAFVVGKAITVGRHCRVAAGTIVIDSSGHPTDPTDRIAGLPPRPEEVKPVVIEDNVWIGNRCMIFPGVRIGEGSVVSAGSIVMNDVAANTVVAGNPARKIATLKPQQVTGPAHVPAATATVSSAEGPAVA
jgi:acetyltransferase-like isoleucine patch superfamily enzyme